MWLSRRSKRDARTILELRNEVACNQNELLKLGGYVIRFEHQRDEARRLAQDQFYGGQRADAEDLLRKWRMIIHEEQS